MTTITRNKIEINESFKYLDYMIYINNPSLNLCNYTFCKLCNMKIKMLYCSGYITQSDITVNNIKILFNPGYFTIDKCNCCDITKKIKVMFFIDTDEYVFTKEKQKLPFYKELPFETDEQLTQYLLPFLHVKNN